MDFLVAALMFYESPWTEPIKIFVSPCGKAHSLWALPIDF